jgi:hypothetical protein
MADAKSTEPEPGALEEFLREAESFLTSTLDTIVKAIGDADDAPLILAHGGAAQDQLAKITQHVRSSYQSANVELRRDVDHFMQTQSATTLARNGQAALKKVAAKGLFGDGIFGWVETIMHEIKKLIAWLSKMFHWPDWITSLLELLDEIIHEVLGLFGGILGRSRSKIMTELSSLEVEFWDQLAAHRRFIAAANGARPERED